MRSAIRCGHRLSMSLLMDVEDSMTGAERDKKRVQACTSSAPFTAPRAHQTAIALGDCSGNVG